MSDYADGHAAGWAEAVSREDQGDAVSAAEGPTWFVGPRAHRDDAAMAEYERGFLAGWSDFFEGRD